MYVRVCLLMPLGCVRLFVEAKVGLAQGKPNGNGQGPNLHPGRAILSTSTEGGSPLSSFGFPFYGS